jgi:aminocarboxymuconate-semialdehyde decarboxylase
MVANLMFGGVLDELPDLKICAAHGGGFAPYQIGRVEHGYRGRPARRALAKTPPRQLLGRLFFDTLTLNPLALRYLVDPVGREQVALGTNAPFDMGDEDPLQTVGDILSLTPEEQKAILADTATRLLSEEAV